MTLQELRTYYRLREYQISHLLNAMDCHKQGKHFEHQTYCFLFYWADAMWEADALWQKLGKSNAFWKARGKL